MCLPTETLTLKLLSGFGVTFPVEAPGAVGWGFGRHHAGLLCPTLGLWCPALPWWGRLHHCLSDAPTQGTKHRCQAKQEVHLSSWEGSLPAAQPQVLSTSTFMTPFHRSVPPFPFSPQYPTCRATICHRHPALSCLAPPEQGSSACCRGSQWLPTPPVPTHPWLWELLCRQVLLNAATSHVPAALGSGLFSIPTL